MNAHVDNKSANETSLDDTDENETKGTKNANDDLIMTHMKPNTYNQYDHGNQIVRLNVGGKIYMTLVSTLTSFHDTNPHVLGAMFSGTYLLKPDINGNEYFIDRDGEHFKHILTILRDGPDYFVQKRLSTLTADTIVCLQKETEYFGLDSLVFDKNNCKQSGLRLLPSKSPIHWKPDWFCHGLGGKSLILKDDYPSNTRSNAVRSTAIPKEFWSNFETFYISFRLDSIKQASNGSYSGHMHGNLMCHLVIRDMYGETSDKCEYFSWRISNFIFTSLELEKSKDTRRVRSVFKITINPTDGFVQIENYYTNQKYGHPIKAMLNNIPCQEKKALTRIVLEVNSLPDSRCVTFQQQ